MDDDEPRLGELTTANYGWTKPNVGNSDDAWGGMLNADLDGIDATVHTVSGVANAAYPASNPSGYQTAAQVTASLAPYALTASVPVASTAAPIMDSVAAVGTGTTWARADHVHPLAFQVMGDNRIINGDMRIDQRNNGAATTPTVIGSTYVIDRWIYNASQASKMSCQRGGAAPNVFAIGFGNALIAASLSAYTALATDIFQLAQKIEADLISDFLWGTAGAQPVTLSFWVTSTLTGSFSGAITNDASTRSYPFSYSIPVANTWTKIVITVPGDNAGTWVMSGNATALLVHFDLGCGANARGPAGAWNSNNNVGVTGSISVVATNGATFSLTGVKLEIGSVATPFNRQSLAKSMADCQRYYQVGQTITSSWGSAGGTAYTPVGLPVWMRASPTNTPTNTSTSNATGLTGGTYNGATLYFSVSVTATGGYTIGCTYTASAEL